MSKGNLKYDAICAAILGADHTYQAMERGYHYPKLADREQPRTWEENSAFDAWARAKMKAQEVLATYHSQYPSPDQDSQIRAAFNIAS